MLQSDSFKTKMQEIGATVPSLYEYYTAGGVNKGLVAEGPRFTLNNREITLYSGAMHYFRVPRQYWRDRLRKMRAAGLNAVETYVPWNLHEYQNNTYDFGQGGSEMKDFLDVKEYLKIAKEEDLLAIVRPGPYICSEWEFGGLPSWLLREEDIKVRTSDQKYMQYVERYFKVLLPLLAVLQFTKGGPIIAMQIENEYGSTEQNGKVDKLYMEQLEKIIKSNGIVELLFTSDGVASHKDIASLPGVLQTANFQTDPEKEFKVLQQLQPNRPLMSMEYWTGWFDHWSEKHHNRSSEQFADVLQRILKYPASVNMYMFHGGTNWGFLNGANIGDGSTDNAGFQPDTTSYDYDAPLTENGDYTDKYVQTKKIINEHNKILTRIPMTPTETTRIAYNPVKITQMMTLETMERQVEKIASPKLLPMELLDINNNSGQSYGYIVYRKTNLKIKSNSILKISGRVCDTVMVLLNGVLISKPLSTNNDLNGFGYWRMKDSTINLGPGSHLATGATLELVVENWGRNNFGSLEQFVQFKGLWQGPVFINNIAISDWDIYPLEFKKKWTNSLEGWESPRKHLGPALYKGNLRLEKLYDTYIDMTSWTKGFVIVNGFVLGRHAIIGPQMTLYLPAPFLKLGDNEIIIFEHFNAAEEIRFNDKPKFLAQTTELPFNN